MLPLGRILAVVLGPMLALGCAAAAPAQISPELQAQLEAADVATIRLPPSVFKQAPARVRSALESRGCLIPQTWLASNPPHNLIRGELRQKGTYHWAALCSRQRTSTILVIEEESGAVVDELEPRADRDYLQGVGGEEIGFSRAITAVGREYIEAHYRAFGGPEPPPVDHQGIDDAFVEKASSVLYFHQGKWLTLTGAD